MNPHVIKKLFWESAMPVVGVFVIILQLTRWLPAHVADPNTCDADVYQAAARHAHAGEQVYGRQQRTLVTEVPTGFFYPPSALAIISPAAHLEKTTWRYVCFGLTLAAMWALAAALVKLGTGRADLNKTLALGTLLSVFPPIAQSMSTGNFDMAIIAMTAWALAAPRIAAPLLVVAASIKVYPAFALIALIPRTDTDAETDGSWFRAQVLLSCFVIAVFTRIALGSSQYVVEWIQLGLRSLSDPVLHDGNWSLSTILVHSSLHADVASTPRLARLILSIAPMAATLVTAYYTRKQPASVSATATLIVGTWFTAFCWWWRIIPLLTIPAAIWWRRRAR